ncbi:hypothetical protein JL720_15154 [Aureococcus anophagefferens]|nr:hypothetical protein JL720_15154 [Aureococcus anophagefferens]
MSRFLFGLLACASASWTPELKLKKHGDQSKVSQEWGPAIRATLKASLHAYADKAISSPKAAAKLLAKTAERLDAVVAVLDNRVFVDEAFLEGPGAEDGMRHLRVVAGRRSAPASPTSPTASRSTPTTARAAATAARARRSSSSTSGGATAPAACSRAAAFSPPPPLTSTKRKGDDWEVRAAHAAAAAAARKWAGRRDAALWRRRDGELDGGGRGDCVAGAPAPLLALGPPFLFDCEGACAFPRAALDACARGDIAAPPGAFDKLRRNRAAAAGELRDYKYLLSAPPARYYPALQDGVTHVAVTAKNARAKVDDLRAEDAKVSTLRHHALQVHKSLLCATCTLRFVQLALRSFAAHFGFQKVLDGADGRRAFLRDGLKSWRGTLLEVKFGDALTLAETYQHESYTMVAR